MIHPSSVQISQSILDDLSIRLSLTRWPDEAQGFDRNMGANLAYMKELIEYWQNQFYWRKQEAKLNQSAQFKADVDGTGIHFIHKWAEGQSPFPSSSMVGRALSSRYTSSSLFLPTLPLMVVMHPIPLT